MRLRHASLALLPLASGCFLFGSKGQVGGGLVQQKVLDLGKFEVRQMHATVKGNETTLCPGGSIELDVSLELRHLKNKKLGTVTAGMSGSGDAKFWGKLEFSNFAFDGRGGKSSDNGRFRAEADHFATATTGFQFGVQLRSQPDKFTKVFDFKPVYCATSIGRSGPSGAPGWEGEAGMPGAEGEGGGEEDFGGNGGAGGAGGMGTDGQPGGVGPKVLAFATAVKTPFHDKLILIELAGGDAPQRMLFDPTQRVTVYARGGNGGSGGAGGRGGTGGPGGDGVSGGSGGPGGAGGTGGRGADGGPGGRVQVMLDPDHPWLADVVVASANGGAGGLPGEAGYGGAGGPGGAPTVDEGKEGPAGPDGPSGQEGDVAGRGGPPGTAKVSVGSVDAAFAGLPAEIERLTP